MLSKTYDVSNDDCLGVYEVELVQFVVDGVNLLIDMGKNWKKERALKTLSLKRRSNCHKNYKPH